MKLAAGADEQVPVLIVGGGGAGLTASMLLAGQGVDHLLVSARPQHVGPAKGARPEPARDGGAGGRRRGGGDRAAQHPRRADGGDGLLRGVRRTGPGLRAPPGPPGVLGRRRGGRALVRGQLLAAAEPATDPSRAAAQGPGGGTIAGTDPLRPRAHRPGAGQRGRPGDDPRPRHRPQLHRRLPVPARRGRRAAGGRPDRPGV